MTIEMTDNVSNIFSALTTSIDSIIPTEKQVGKPVFFGKELFVQFGVMIAFTGDVRGHIIFVGNKHTYSRLGEWMFGMPIEGDLLTSFAGELANMLSGSICTNMSDSGMILDITAPTIMDGETKLSGYERAFKLQIDFVDKAMLTTYLLVENHVKEATR